MSQELKQRAREAIEQLAALDSAKKPGGGAHGQVVGCEPWVIRTNGFGLQCLYDAQVLLDEVLDPFERRATVPAAHAGWVSVPVEPSEAMLRATKGPSISEPSWSHYTKKRNAKLYAAMIAAAPSAPEAVRTRIASADDLAAQDAARETETARLAKQYVDRQAEAASVRDADTLERIQTALDVLADVALPKETWRDVSNVLHARHDAILALQGKPEAASTCAWTQDDPDSGTWQSSCGEAWVFMDGGPAENSVRHCQGCGKPVAIEAAKGGELTPCAYRYTLDAEIRIEEARQIEGPPLWAVRKHGNCLSKQGEWEWEPRPSSRDDEFLARCRFESLDAAIVAIEQHIKGGGNADQT